MSLIPANIEYLAFAFQVDKDTPADNPTIAIVISDESLDPGVQKTALPETDRSAQQPGLVVVGAQPGGTFKKWVRPNEEDFFLYALLGANLDGGGPANWTHEASVDGDSPFSTPYLSMWQVWPGFLAVKYTGIRFGQGSYSSSPGNGWEVEYALLGIEATYLDAEPDVDGLFVDEQPHTWPEYVTSLAGDQPGTVNQASLVINRNTTRYPGDNGFSSFDVPNGLIAVTGSLELAAEDDEILRAANTGAVDGTALTTEIFDESLAMELTRDADTGIRFDVAAIQFQNTKVAVKTDGSVATLTTDFQSKKQADITTLIATLVKNQAENADRS